MEPTTQGSHLAWYAKKHGPLWAWPCFAFEDLNGWLLRSAHGTGNVCMQLLSMLHGLKQLKHDASNIADESLKEFTKDMLSSGRRVKTLMQVTN
ncbi:hypothetical protein MAR_018744 [Mya arenaria]|uniref:Uncharacterized protein n=1 Tax=Mya arenaria TaxID=6604 RepID=A0ABY7ENL8_MYAAR|nr:hypothetical protein MAR_018744 [Mya arenaria]